MPHLVADAIGERRLEQPAVARPLIGHGLAGRDVHDVAAVRLEQARDLDRVGRLVAALVPVDRRDAHRHRALGGPRGAHRVEHLEREAHAIREAAAVIVACAGW